MRRAPLLVLLLALVLATGCGRNHASSLLTPTGITPGPAVPTGSVFGFVTYDPVNTPDLSRPPFPITIATLSRDGVAVANDTLAIDSTRFHFEDVAPGTYTVTVQAQSFLGNAITNLAVRNTRIDAGNVTLGIDNAYLNTIGVFLTGNIPGFGLDQLMTYESALDQNVLGIWTYPNALYDPPTSIPRGTYRFKLVTDISSTLSNLVGWGWTVTDTLRVPFVGHRVVRTSGPATDIVARFDTTGVYQVTLDERRQSLSIVRMPATQARLLRIRS